MQDGTVRSEVYLFYYYDFKNKRKFDLIFSILHTAVNGINVGECT